MLTSIIKKFSTTTIVLLLIAQPLEVKAIPYSEKDAFCLDYTDNSFSSPFERSLNSEHTIQKIYNYCMNNAVRLIQEAEQKKRNSQIAEQKRLEREANERTKLNQEIDDLFSDYF